MSSSIYKYIDIDSSYRNRNKYPKQSDFVIPVTYVSQQSSNVNNAQDPVSLAYPFDSGNTQAGSTTTNIVLSAVSSNIQNYYANAYLGLQNEYAMITSYDSVTKIATTSTAFTVAPPINTPYTLRYELPIFTSTIGVGSTQLSVNLGVSATSIDNFYTGKFIYLTSGTNSGESRLIVSYNGTTKNAMLVTNLPFVPLLGDTFEILQYSKDNYTPMLYNSTLGFNNAVCYSIELLYVTIPNQITKNSPGGPLDSYPYFYVALYNEGNNHSDSILFSNNSNARMALFRCPMPLTLSTELFFTLKDSKCIQVVKFKPDSDLRFKILLPNGEPINFQQNDTVSPALPNPKLQISASFSIRRIVTD